MASQQTRIAALLDGLAALGAKRTGMPIDADEWNSLIATVRGTLEVAAAQDDATSGALDTRYAPVDHRHLAEVTREWLDSELRVAVGTGEAAPSVTATVAGTHLGAQVGRVLDEVGRLRGVLEDQQARIDRTVTADVDRTRDIVDLRGRVTAVDDLRGAVAGLEGRMRTAATQLDGLEGLRSSLSDATGAPIDVGALQASVTELGRLRDNLTDGQGNLVRMRDVLARLDEDRVVTPGGGGDLDGRFGELRADLEGRVDERLNSAETRLGATAEERATQLRGDLIAQFSAQIDQSATATRTGLEQFADGRVAAAEARLNTALTGALAEATTSVRGELAGLARSAARDGLGDVDARIGAAVDASRAAVTESLRAELTQVATSTADARAAAAVAPLTERVTGLATRVDGLDATVDAAVADAVGARIDQVTADLDARTTARLDEARTALAASIEGEVGRAVDTRVGDLDARVAGVVDDRLAGVDARIDQRVAASTAGLADQVRAEVQTQFAGIDLAGQLAALENRVTVGLRAELAAAETRIDARRSTALADLATQLRSETEAGRVGLENRLTTELATTRLELDTVRGGIGRGGVVLRPNG